MILTWKIRTAVFGTIAWVTANHIIWWVGHSCQDPLCGIGEYAAGWVTLLVCLLITYSNGKALWDALRAAWRAR